MLGLRRLWLRPVAAGTTILITTLIAACGSSDAPAPAAAPAVAPTIVPATSAPEPTAVPTPEFVPGPREATFADGRFKVNFLYRSDPDLAAAIDVVDVESILEPALERIASLIEGDSETQVINFKGPVSSTLFPESRAQLETEGYVIGPWDPVTHRISFFLNPNGSIAMEDLWRTIIPAEIADSTYWFIRIPEETGTYVDSLGELILANGLAMAFEQEAFPDLEEALRQLRPEFAAVIYDLTPEGEAHYWSEALPNLDLGWGQGGVLSRFLDFGGRTGEFPFGTPAAVGLRIVEAYQENNPGVTASSLVRVSPEEIFEGSNYSP